MSFEKCTDWEVVNDFTLKDGDFLHTCVPQTLTVTLNSVSATFSVRRDLAVLDGERAPQSMSKRIEGWGSIQNASIDVFSINAGSLGFLNNFTSVAIHSADQKRTNAAEMVPQTSGYQHSGFSAQPVPRNGLMSFENGLMMVHKKTDVESLWGSAMHLWLPQDFFQVIFNAIATAQKPPKVARLLVRANLFETEVDAALNEGERRFGMHVPSATADGASVAAMLDDFELSISPTAM